MDDTGGGELFVERIDSGDIHAARRVLGESPVIGQPEVDLHLSATRDGVVRVGRERFEAEPLCIELLGRLEVERCEDGNSTIERCRRGSGRHVLGLLRW